MKWHVLLVATLSPSTALIFRSPSTARVGACLRKRAACAHLDDPYGVLGVERDATAAQIKQAYRRLALRSHPDVNKSPGARDEFACIAQAYSLLSEDKRREFEASGGAGKRATSPEQSSHGPGGLSEQPGQGNHHPHPPSAAAAELPTSGELGDSFGSLLGDVFSAVRKVVGRGDWLELLGELRWGESGKLEEILRSCDQEALKSELESCRFVQSALRMRLDRQAIELMSTQTELDKWQRTMRAAGEGMGRSVERQFEKDLERCGAQLQDVKRLLMHVQERDQLIERRLDHLCNDSNHDRRGGGGPRTGVCAPHHPRKRQQSVEEELQRMKREMGR